MQVPVSFRTRIFLAILLPAAFLVIIAVTVALMHIRSQVEQQARDGFDRAGKELNAVLKERFKQLDDWRKPFDTPRIHAAITEAAESGDAGDLKDQLGDEFRNFKEPDFYEVRGKKDEVLLRKPAGSSPIQPWMKDPGKKEVLTEFDGKPYLAVKVKPDKGLFILGAALAPFLDRMHESLGIDLALANGDKVVYSTLQGWNRSLGTGGTIHVAGKKYLAGSEKPGQSELELVLFLFDESPFDQVQARALTFGAAGLVLALLVAGLVSSSVSRGVSQPVERLVDATHKVASGDYSVKVEAVGKDEIGRLGAAFNEMTVGLRKRQEIMEMTLSRDVAEVFLKGGTERGGERRQVTIVFMDIRGYTSGTEGMDPADVVLMLNDLMDLLAGAIERHGGLVNKFLGDGLMAMFGAPKTLENHALHAVEAAIEMQKQMERWNQRRVARGLAAFYSGIGINTGDAVCGKVGGRNRLEYTLIGEEVNLASRICGKAAPRQVLITKQTRDLLGDKIQVRQLEPVVVKGLSYPIKVFEALG